MQRLRDVAIAIPGKERVGRETRAQQALGLSARTTGDDRELLGRDELRSDAGPCAAFADRLAEARQIRRLQIPQAAVQSTVVMKGGRAGEVVALDERDVQPAGRRVPGRHQPVDPPSDDEHVESPGGERIEITNHRGASRTGAL